MAEATSNLPEVFATDEAQVEVPDGHGGEVHVEPELLDKNLSSVSLIYRLDVNEFRGASNPQLMVETILDYVKV